MLRGSRLSGVRRLAATVRRMAFYEIPVPSHYKNHHGTKSGPCLLCQTRTRGVTTSVHVACGVFVQLCKDHAQEGFRLHYQGRDFTHSLRLAWKSAGCLTKLRYRALDVAERQIKERLAARARGEDDIRHLPGSYRCPSIRAAVEEACKKGAGTIRQLVALVQSMLKMELKRGRMLPPSRRTLRRWRAERRWERPGWAPPAFG